MCSPYVSVKVVPGPLARARTSSRPRTLFPLFSETLDLAMAEGWDWGPDSCLLLLTVKDLGPLGDSLPLGSCLLPLSQLPPSPPDASLATVEALQLPLTNPGPGCLDILAALEARRTQLPR